MTLPRNMRTTEVVKQMAADLALLSFLLTNAEQRARVRALADEGKLRALWIERAKVDTGVSEEWRRAIRAIDDAPDSGDPS